MMEKEFKVGQRIELFEVIVETIYTQGTFPVGHVLPGIPKDDYPGLIDVMSCRDKGKSYPLVLVPFSHYPQQCRRVGAVTIKSLKSDTNV